MKSKNPLLVLVSSNPLIPKQIQKEVLELTEAFETFAEKQALAKAEKQKKIENDKRIGFKF